MADSKGSNAPPPPATPDEIKEKKRRKQFKRMGKILAVAWDWDAAFQDKDDDDDSSSNGNNITCLTDVGQKLDEQVYRLGRHGWEDFSRDLASVYHAHIHRYVCIVVLVCVCGLFWNKYIFKEAKQV